MALWNPLRRLFGHDNGAPEVTVPPAPAAPPRPQVVAPPPPVPELPPAINAGVSDRELDYRFVALLLGSPAPVVAPTPAERAVIDQLGALAERGLDPELVPRLPAVLPRLIALSRRDDAAPRELAGLLARDPALVGEVVQLANSPRYRTAREIEDLQGALMVLGQMGLSQLVTRAAMRPIFNLAQGRFGRHAGGRLWELSERVAVAAAALRQGRTDAFAAYLAGTVAPVGLMAAVRVLDQRYAAPEPPASVAFHLALWQQAARVAAQAARQWSFPEEVVQALDERARHAAAGAGELALAVQAADRAARRQLLAAAGVALEGGAASPDEARADTELDQRYGALTENG
jgi:HD-like signal output (HDOD) protein